MVQFLKRLLELQSHGDILIVCGGLVYSQLTFATVSFKSLNPELFLA